MDMNQLEILEAKINQAVELIEKLRSENQELRNLNRELRTESETKDLTIQQLKEENKNFQQMQAHSSLGRDKEEKIKSKVEQMLSRLDELQLNL
ncbi:MAG: cell division protein ZapB [bacterium]